MRKVKVIFLLICGCIMTIQAQQKSLEEKLDMEINVEAIMSIVDDHYDEIKKGTRTRTVEASYKHWVRWAMRASLHTDGNGNTVDPTSYIDQAIKQFSSTNLDRSSVGSWYSVGPSSINSSVGSAVGVGRVDRIAFHPWDEDIFYLCTSGGGLLKTTNGGQTYSHITDNLPSMGVSGLIVSKFNPNKLFLLSGDGDGGGFITNAGYRQYSKGVFASYDGGINWYATAPFPGISGNLRGYNIAQDGSNSDILLVATNQGIFKTINGGGSWYKVLDGLTYEIKYKPASSDVIYSTQSGAFFSSDDGGETWGQDTLFNVPLQSGRLALAVSNAALNSVYLFSGAATTASSCSGTGNFGGIYISTNSGFSFTQRITSPNIVTSCCDGKNGRSQSGYDLAIGVNHADPTEIVTGAIRVWRGNVAGNGTISMEVADGRCAQSNSTGYVHADVHDVEYNPLTHEVYACTDGGLSKSVDGGANWIDLSSGLTNSQIYHMDGSKVNINNYMIGLQDNGTKSHESGSTPWDQVLSADGYDIAYFKNSATTGILSWNSQINLFTSNGDNRDSITPPASAGEFFPRVEVHNTINSMLYAGYSNIYVSSDGGNSWNDKGAAGNWAITACPSNNSVFYAAGGGSAFSTTGEMFRSANAGLTWTQISGNTGFPTEELRITDIKAKPNNSNIVWITMAGYVDGSKVYASINGGTTWGNYSLNLPNVPINCIELDANNNIYVGTEIGVFYRALNVSGSKWIPYSNNLPRVPITELLLYPNDNILRAATFGRGVWQSDLYSSCPSNVTIIFNANERRIYEASETIVGQSILYGGENTDIVFKSGYVIDLKPGFEVFSSTELDAYISPCGVYKEQ